MGSYYDAKNIKLLTNIGFYQKICVSTYIILYLLIFFRMVIFKIKKFLELRKKIKEKKELDAKEINEMSIEST